jgi:hypothetical protein
MTSLVSNFLIMFYLLFSLIKSWENLLVYSTQIGSRTFGTGQIDDQYFAHTVLARHRKEEEE